MDRGMEHAVGLAALPTTAVTLIRAASALGEKTRFTGGCGHSRWPMGRSLSPIRRASKATIPEDLRAAIDADPRARKTCGTLGRMHLFALAFRLNNMKTPAGRATAIQILVALLARGETIGPERPRARTVT